MYCLECHSMVGTRFLIPVCISISLACMKYVQLLLFHFTSNLTVLFLCKPKKIKEIYSLISFTFEMCGNILLFKITISQDILATMVMLHFYNLDE